MVKHFALHSSPDFYAGTCWRSHNGSPEPCWLIFLAQCTWLISQNLRSGDMDLRESGIASTLAYACGIARHPPPRLIRIPPSVLAHRLAFATTTASIPIIPRFWYLISSAPCWFGRDASSPTRFSTEGWLARVPHLAFGLLLGASLWYVARRLYGNEGGFVALTLYCFSPGS